MNLARRKTTGGRKKKTVPTVAKRVELVELIAAPSPARAKTGYTVRVGQLGIEVGEDFDAGTLRRLVAVLSAC